MARVKELLNVVVNCEKWGRLRCSAASIGYERRIRKGVIHRRVTRLSRKTVSSRKIFAARSSQRRVTGHSRNQTCLLVVTRSSQTALFQKIRTIWTAILSVSIRSGAQVPPS